jgi:hypothetical protein
VVEDALTAVRTANPRRKPQRSDGIDLMHAVIALAYCDYFLIRDGYAKTCAMQVIKGLSSRRLAALAFRSHRSASARYPASRVARMNAQEPLSPVY